MKKLYEKEIKSLKRKSIWPHILFFLIGISIGAIIVIISVSAILSYIFESKYMESKSLSYDIEKSIDRDLEDGFSYEKALSHIENSNKSVRAVTLTDKDRNIIYSYGEAINFNSDNLINSNYDLDINLNFNSETVSTVSEVFDNISEVWHTDLASDAASIKMNQEVYRYSFWIERDNPESEYNLYILSDLIFVLNDCIIILLSALLIGSVFAVLIIICLISAISNIVTQRRLISLLLKDNITKGSNYLSFQASSSRILSSGLNKRKSYALIDFSLMKYQSYCSLYGTDEGDTLLFYINKYLKQSLKPGELVSRVSGSDFVLLLKVPNEYGNAITTERINSIIEGFKDGVAGLMLVNNPNRNVLKNVVIKCGVYIIPNCLTDDWKERRKKKNLDIDQLYMKAGIAKKTLSDEESVMFYNHDLLEEEIWRQKVEDNMEEALKKEEFQVFIQPKYNPKSKKLAGGEALVRWKSEEEGFISPGRFIPIFENCGFITKLDDYMISHTAALQAKWLEEGKSIVPISVNVSRAHFAQPDLAEHIKNLVDEYPLPHKYIEIELTESAFFDDKNALLGTVKKLQEYGFEVSMDDFGAGYSSLNSLKDLPLNVLKLDAEFFRGEDSGERGEIVVSQAISLAKMLNMKIVAEGVEKEDQVTFLASKECDMIQGFYFDKPMPSDEYETRMQSEQTGSKEDISPDFSPEVVEKA